MWRRPLQWLFVASSLLFPAGGSLFAQSLSTSACPAWPRPPGRPFEKIPRLELGVQLVPLALSSPIVSGDIGGGFHVGYNLTRNFSLDSDLDFFRFGQTASQTRQTKMGLFGLRAGITSPEAGFYVKLRPGILHFPYVGSLQTFGPPRHNYFVLDVGATTTYYFHNHTYIRVDLGDMIVYANVASAGATTGSPTPPHSRNNAMLSLGLGLHF